jgi:hypothetical protein
MLHDMMMDDHVKNCPGGENCVICMGGHRIWADPSVVGWTHVEGQLWKDKDGKEFRFKDIERMALLIWCPNCYPSMHPNIHTVH